MSSLDAVRARFARNEGLPFADILTEASIREVLNEHGVQYRDRVFSPVTTIWGFLSQVLSEDHSCRDTVSRIIAHRAANGITDVLAQYGQLLQCAKSHSHECPLHLGKADRGRVAGER